MSDMTPEQIVSQLDQFIIGQDKAKRAVAIALRNRWRRMQIDEPLRSEITPKNILMIGPTGVGKTEIARRLSDLAQAPFLKVEATKFTEVGYVGRDVESIVRDLAQITFNKVREREFAKHDSLAQKLAVDQVVESLMNNLKETYDSQESLDSKQVREDIRRSVEQGKLNDQKIKVAVSKPQVNMGVMSVPGLESIGDQMQGMLKNLGNLGLGNRKEHKTMTVKHALRAIKQEELEKMIDQESLHTMVVEETEQRGIVFVDEIDKLARRSQSTTAGEVSREGVQRDLLPLIEGSTVNTRYGMIKTNYILFIAAGAFHFSKPSELIPELQGRLPIRVELEPLDTDAFVRILSEPDNSLVKQYQALLAQEGLDVVFSEEAIKRIATIAYEINRNTENIGARRLQTVMERLLEDISFTAPSLDNKQIKINSELVDQQLASIAKDQDLSSYIL
ncbi:MAG: ATP-dependent protease ATPase subunit HslU [Chromatiales bacterium]|nr:ATP-dependent protease ATPase subunit HslU [Chromatiales bacterium]